MPNEFDVSIDCFGILVSLNNNRRQVHLETISGGTRVCYYTILQHCTRWEKNQDNYCHNKVLAHDDTTKTARLNQLLLKM